MIKNEHNKGRLSYHLGVECFSQLSFDSEVYTKSATAADFIYISESNDSWKNIRHKDDRMNSLYHNAKNCVITSKT